MRHFTAAGLIVCLLASASLAAEPVKKWEYAMFMTTPQVSLWKSRTEGHAGMGGDVKANLYMVYTKMGGKVVAAEKITQIDVLNLAGEMGWELVSVKPDRSDGETYIFKRPSSK